jgi:hypothetical protein
MDRIQLECEVRREAIPRECEVLSTLLLFKVLCQMDAALGTSAK